MQEPDKETIFRSVKFDCQETFGDILEVAPFEAFRGAEARELRFTTTEGSASGSVILDKEQAIELARRLLEWTGGFGPEAPKKWKDL